MSANIRYRPLFSLIIAAASFVHPLVLEARQPPRTVPDLSVPGEHILAVPLGRGVNQRFIFAAPRHARATIVMLPGGAGDLGLRERGDILHGENFVVRTRSLWTSQGYAVLIPDTVGHTNLRGDRSSIAYGEVVERLIAFSHMRNPGPVYLLGTSQGSIAAVNAAARARPGTIAGLILTESVTVLGASGETVFDANPAGVRVPVLIIANKADVCRVAPPADAVKIARRLTASPSVEVHYVDGGQQRSANPCGSLTPHGYYGIEPSVVAIVTRWMRSQVTSSKTPR